MLGGATARDFPYDVTRRLKVYRKLVKATTLCTVENKAVIIEVALIAEYAVYAFQLFVNGVVDDEEVFAGSGIFYDVKTIMIDVSGYYAAALWLIEAVVFRENER